MVKMLGVNDAAMQKLMLEATGRVVHPALSSVLYSNFSAFPDLALMLDAPVFFFRNALEGAQTCAPQACPKAHRSAAT